MSHPRNLSLRIAVAGSRDVQDETEVRYLAKEVLTVIETSSLTFARDLSSTSNGQVVLSISLASGLADGADQIVSEEFLSGAAGRIKRSISAILPFDVSTYVDKSPIANTARFKLLFDRSSPALVLPGRYASGKDEAAKGIRAAAYRAQANTLLDNSDLLIAVDNPAGSARAGGTRETISRAISRGRAVVLLSIGDTRILVLDQPPESRGSTNSHQHWRTSLDQLVRSLLVQRCWETKAADSIDPVSTSYED